MLFLRIRFHQWVSNGKTTQLCCLLLWRGNAWLFCNENDTLMHSTISFSPGTSPVPGHLGFLWTASLKCVCVCVCVWVCVCAHAQSYLTLCDPMDCSWPNSSTIQFSRLENWSRLLFPPPRDLSRSGIELHLLYIGRRFFTNCSTGEAQSEVFGLYAFEGKPLRSPALRSTAFQSIAEYTRRSL